MKKDKKCGKFVEQPKATIQLNNGLTLNVSNAENDEVIYLQAGQHQRYTIKIINDDLRREIGGI